MAFSDQMTPASPLLRTKLNLVSELDAGFGWKVWTLWLIGFGIFSMVFPRDASFDVLHYQLHNGWSALNDRLTTDLAPAEIHSFFNPVYNMVIWWLIAHLPGLVVGFLLGLVHGLVLPALYIICRQILALCGLNPTRNIALILAAIGFACAPSIALIASVRNDMFGALAYLVALTILLGPLTRTPSFWRAGLASLIIGLCVGLKLTNIIYAAGLAVFVLTRYCGVLPRLKVILACAGAGLAGIALGGGWWMLVLTELYANPVYPNMNGIFEAPLGPTDVSRDTRFLPDSLLAALTLPVRAGFDLMIVNEGGGPDLRLVLTYFGLLSLPVLGLIQRYRGQVVTTISRPVLAFLMANLATLIAWIGMFSIMRYAAALWLIGPLLGFVLVKTIWPRGPSHISDTVLAGSLGLVLLVTTQAEQTRRVAWTSLTDPYVSVNRPDTLDYSGALIVMAGIYPTAFTAFAFPETTITHADGKAWSKPFLDNYRFQIHDAIKAQTKPIYAVLCVQEADTLAPTERLSTRTTLSNLKTELGLTGDPATCLPLVTNMDTAQTKWIICPVKRSDTS